MLCILYLIAVGTCLGVVALVVERMLPTTWPRRWLWCAVIPLSIFLPAYYRFHHTWSVVDALQHGSVGSQLAGALGLASRTAFDPAWWVQTRSYDALINRLWLSASALLLLWGLTHALRVALVLHQSRAKRRDSGAPDVVDGVPVVVTDVMGPATVGVLRSRVVVPHWVLALPPVQRRYILCHEDEHRRSHDARLLFLASLTLILMPWNLALWWQLRRLRLAVEMDCDNRVVAALGDANAYGELLLRVAEATSRGPRLQPALLGGVGMLERRLTMLLAPTPLRNIQRVLFPALALGLSLLVLSMPHPIVGGAHAHASTESAVTSAATSIPAAR